ncbi:MAG: thioredoxin domain-containing protein, partial [Acidimicrobiia bacterium]
MNRLSDETSPYLLQHANNPVDWYPWGPEALKRANAEGKPILLSIGYAACHWCHVMERESFEDEATAAYMNQHFISIKVDREERPDIDGIYMDAVQIMTGHGGWPMTMFLTPDGKPFYGGTYFPPDDRQGMPSFRRVLEAVVAAWTDRREEIELQGKELVDHLAQQSRLPSTNEPLTSTLLANGAAGIGSAFDGNFGGFGKAPKFPQAPVLEFMLRSAMRSDQARQMVELTLSKMATGGIYDQIGGGFHRYSVDAEWLVPHFEKMLYDNAQLARVYTHAWQAWKNELYSRVTIETLEYLIREMKEQGGAFHSSEDADSEGVEGKFYVWSYEEFMQVSPDAASYYGVKETGNFEGSNILTASEQQPPVAERKRLLEVRSRRVRPGRDDKILTSWNGLAISALAEAGSAFGRMDFLKAAEATAGFLLDNLRTDGGRLLHNYKGGRATVLGFLEDYAYLAEGLFCLWESTFDPRWINECIT